MPYSRWIVASSLVDEYGIALPPVIEAAYFQADNSAHSGLHGITLFANGHVMQLIEGDTEALHHAMRNLRNQSKLFGMVPVLREKTPALQARGVAVGVSRFADEIAGQLPGEVQVFPLNAEEVCKRTAPGKVRDMLLDFI
ncbi:hypothetical protein [Rhodoferax bucti]|uniref:hypothetical protein n=1 Tax=Rhodoferax bucti TaxID=2576305 RepID=UPI001109D76C|nr:hypothetical protein [Rhodoferax bucti]